MSFRAFPGLIRALKRMFMFGGLGILLLIVMTACGNRVQSESSLHGDAKSRTVPIATKDRFTADEAKGEIAKDWGLKPPTKSDAPKVSRSEALDRSRGALDAVPTNAYIKLARLTKSKYNEHLTGLVWLVTKPNALNAKTLPECERPLKPGGVSIGEISPSMTLALVPADGGTFPGGAYIAGFLPRCRIVAEPGWPHKIDYSSMETYV
jgi:hypothetical protein